MLVIPLSKYKVNDQVMLRDKRVRTVRRIKGTKYIIAGRKRGLSDILGLVGRIGHMPRCAPKEALFIDKEDARW